MTATSAVISWTIPEILYTEEDYYVEYGDDITLELRTASQSSGSDMELTNQMYNITLQNLQPNYMYYFVVTAENTVSPKSTDIFTFMTSEDGMKSARILLRMPLVTY